jgi:hypothetical protein
MTKIAFAAAAMAPALAALAIPAFSSPAAAATSSPMTSSWCGAHGSSVGAWVGSTPNLPICGPGPAYGGTWSYVSIPGPFGQSGRYYNATPGFQCVELAERYLAVIDGLGAVMANGAQVAVNYHAAYPATTLVVNGSRGAIGHAPAPGDVISFSYSSSFYGGDGHVAVVVSSQVNQGTGDGTVTIAQENVSSSDYVRNLSVVNWRLNDPTEGGGTEYNWPYAEWLEVPPPVTPALRAHLRTAKARSHQRGQRSPLVSKRPSSLVSRIVGR